MLSFSRTNRLKNNCKVIDEWYTFGKRINGIKKLFNGITSLNNVFAQRQPSISLQHTYKHHGNNFIKKKEIQNSQDLAIKYIKIKSRVKYNRVIVGQLNKYKE